MNRIRSRQLFVGTLVVGGLLALGAGPALADHQPDGKIRRKGENSYIGNDIYDFSLTGVGQTKVAVKQPGRSAKFEVKFQSDLDAGPLGLSGPASDGDFQVTYSIGGVDVTNDITLGGPAGSYNLATGESTPKILVKVKVLADTVNGDSFTGDFWAADGELGGSPDDGVRFVVFAD